MQNRINFCNTSNVYCVRSVRIWSLLVRIQSECEKIRTRKTPNADTFYAVVIHKEEATLTSNQIKCTI